MRLVIDGNEANVSGRVGSNVYAFEILLALEKILRHGQSDVEVTVILSAPPHQEWPAVRDGWNYVIFGPVKMWTQWAAPLYLYKNRSRFDVLYTPGHYAPRFCPIPYISSVMDLAFLVFPEQFARKDEWQLRKWTAYSVEKAAKIAVISEFTKSEVIRLYNLPEEKLILAPPGLAGISDGAEIISDDELLKQAQISELFYLYVGTIQPRKNLVNLIDAFDRLIEKLGQKTPANLQLVIAGKIGWLAADTLERVASSPNQERIVMTGFVSDKLKQSLLRNCLGNFNLGEYEGFGIPALEALRAGSIPVVANNTSLPEVVGKAGLLVAPDDIRRISRAMRRLLEITPAQKQAFRMAAQEQLQKYSYEKSAQIILQVMREICHE